jgi:hypothetical protein
MTNIAMVKPWPIEIDGLPINSMVIFHGKLLVITRCYLKMGADEFSEPSKKTAISIEKSG